jgi:hypothetical protein
MSHTISVRTSMRVQAGTTLPQVIEALRKALDDHHLGDEGFLDMEADAPLEFGVAPLADFDDWISVDKDGNLSLRLATRGTGHGIKPDLLTPMIDALTPLCTERGGYLECVDEDSSPGNDESVCAFFIGQTEQARRLAQVHYGLQKAHDWLAPVLTEATLAEIERIALEGASEPLQERPRMTP